MPANVPNIPRQPGPDRRQGRFADLLALVIDHFFQTGQIVQTSPKTFEIRAGGSSSEVSTVVTIVNSLVTNNIITEETTNNYTIQVGGVVRITGTPTSYLGVPYYPALKRGFTTGTDWQDSADTAWVIHPVTGEVLKSDGTGIYLALLISNGVTPSLGDTRPLYTAWAEPPFVWTPPQVMVGCDATTELPSFKYICRDGSPVDDPADCP